MKPRVVAFLLDRRGAGCCDECIARALGADPADVDSVTSTLARLPDFLRDRWRCTVCGELKIVTRTVVAPRSWNDGGRSGRSRAMPA